MIVADIDIRLKYEQKNVTKPIPHFTSGSSMQTPGNTSSSGGTILQMKSTLIVAIKYHKHKEG